MKYPYQKVALGGTFDRLHVGHEQLLMKAYESGAQVCIGLTQPQMHVYKDYSWLIEPYEKRFANLEYFLQQHHFDSRTTIVPLEDMYGPTIHDASINALVVTPHTLVGAMEVNKQRQLLHMQELPIIQAELVCDDEGQYVSSTRIREGRINRKGASYVKMLRSGLSLNETQKQQLSQPQGKVIFSARELLQLHHTQAIVVVGDVSTKWCFENNVSVTVAVVDGKSERKRLNDPVQAYLFDRVIQAENPAGSVSAEIVKVFEQMDLRSMTLVQVQGEEDLVALAAVLLLPLDTVVLYGQRGMGIVMMRVSEVLKERYALMIENY